MASTHTVVYGDTLWDIAEKYLGSGIKYKELASINNISNPNYIRVGQVIKLSGSSSASSSTNSNQVTIDNFGLQSNADKTLFATWTWSKDNTENYEVIWEYYTADKYWFNGNKSTTEFTYSTYSIPDNAEQVRFKVKPVSKTYQHTEEVKSDGILGTDIGSTTTTKTTTKSYWTANWTSWKTFNVKNSLPPDAPSAPSVKIEDTTLTATLENLTLDATSIEFQVVQNNTKVVKTGTATISTGYAAYSCTVSAGSEYKVRCRAVRSKLYSEWSSYSSNIATEPAKPAGFTACKASKRASDNTYYIYLEWTAINTATSYEIEYTTDRSHFDNPTGSVTKLTIDNGQTKCETYGLETGYTYFFRIRSKNSAGESEWSDVSSVIFGEPPAAPTTWSSTTTAIVGGPLNLYWVHNSSDGSSQTWANIGIELYIDDVLKDSFEIMQKNTTDIEEKDKTSSLDIATYLAENVPTLYKEGVQLKWRVQTAGVSNEVGEWSIVRMIDIHAQPTLELTVTDSNGVSYGNGNTIEALGSFPIRISALAAPASQAPLGYHVTITSNEIYETVDDVGLIKMVNNGEQVYSKYFDQTTALETVISASDVDLENNINYTISCVVAMDSGLSADGTVNFTVSWIDAAYEPNAVISYDGELFVTHIHPYCEEYTTTYYKVTYDVSTDTYAATTETVEVSWGEEVEGATLVTGEQVFSGIMPVTIAEDGTQTGGEEIYYYRVQTGTPIDGVLLSVYRREFDGTFTELAKNIDNSQNIYITDPHPALDYARYRIVAITESTGAVSYYDLPGFAIGESAIIIQWDDDWSQYETSEENPMSQPPWSGSLLRLPYNIDISPSYAVDVSLVEYVGRKHPVSYYGTHLGESATWSTVIPADDKATLYALRRLAIWTGDVYVREPSGTGYWATIGVSFNTKHKDLTIPVTLTIKRVEGGM